MSQVKPELIQHNGKDILYLNFAGMEKERIPGFIEEARALFLSRPKNSLPFLVDVKNMKYDHGIVKSFIDFSKESREYSKGTAILGIDTMKKILYEAAVSISGHTMEHIRFFDGENSYNEAKDWLAAL